jgi:hypothetical protein
MKLWRDWFPDLLPHVPGCPNVLATHELRRAAQVFMQGTRAWQMRLDPVPVPAQAEEVELVPTDSAIEVIRIQSVHMGDKQLMIVTADELDSRFHDDWHLHTGTPERFYQIRPGFIALYPIPDVAQDPLVVRASVCPSNTATGLPDDIALRYWDEIHLGAKSRLMLMPGKRWTNVDLGVATGQAFTSMLNTAHANAARSFGKARIPSKVKWC